MGGNQSKPRGNTPAFRHVPKNPWREIHYKDFERTASYLKNELERHKNTRLNIVLIGHTGAGKSTLINTIFSISRNRQADMAYVKSDHWTGIGSHHFEELRAGHDDLFQQIYFYDTMGFTSSLGTDDNGISNEDLKAVCEGRVPVGHKFNAESVPTEQVEEIKPHCIIFVVSAKVIDELTPDLQSTIREKLESIDNIVSHDIARIVVITKIDCVCEDTSKDIQQIYSSRKVYALVKQAVRTFGVQENRVFPIVNFVNQTEIDAKMSVPILYAIKTALDFASDRVSVDVKDAQFPEANIK